VYCGKQNTCVPDTRITLANKYLQKPCLESQDGVGEAMKKAFVREEESRGNLNLYVCWCRQQELQVAGTISAAVQHWPQQMQGCNYISGSSYGRQDAAFFVRPRVRDGIRLHPQRFHVEHQARLQRHEYMATSAPRLRQSPQKPTYKTYFIFRCILKKRTHVKMLYTSCRINLTIIVFETCIRLLVTESYTVAKYSGLA